MSPACGPETAWKFDYPGQAEFWQPRVAQAMQLCADCPIRAACLQAGIDGKESGVWGGVLLEFGRPVDGVRIIRAWAEANAIDVPRFGRLPAHVREAYEEAIA